MLNWSYGMEYRIRILDTADEMAQVEDVQSIVWPGNKIEIVPAHLLLTAAHNGGLILGSFKLPDSHMDNEDIWEINKSLIPEGSSLVGFVFGFPGLFITNEGTKIKHCSHMMGVHPEHRNKSIGFFLKRAQWQMVRFQGIELITWTYDPLLSLNAHLNISRLGAVCKTYFKNIYGSLRDGLNIGLPTDRFQVDWWVNSQRVNHRLSKKPRKRLDLAHFLAAGAVIINPTHILEDGLPRIDTESSEKKLEKELNSKVPRKILLIEIPADFLSLKTSDKSLALSWRMHTRFLFQQLFSHGYLITDFVYLPGTYPRSFYVAVFGESTL